MSAYIYLDNYRGFSKSFIPIHQVNFLVGENSTGKSSFLDVLNTFHSPSFWAFDAELTRGQLQKRHYLDLVSVAGNKKAGFTLGAIGSEGPQEERTATFVTYKNVDGRPRLSKLSRYVKGKVISVGKEALDPEERQTLLVRSVDLQSAKGHSFHEKVARIHHTKFRQDVQRFQVPEPFLGAPFLVQMQIMQEPELDLSNVSVDVPISFNPNFVALAPIRTRPLRTYDQPQTTYSPEGRHTPYLIRKSLENRSLADEFRVALCRIGIDSGLFSSVEIKEYGKGAMSPFELDIVLGKSSLSIDNVGYGVSQALPVFVEMLARGKGTTFSIQQPEVHLHPKAQATIGDIIAELARHEKKSFFIETHSDYTIDRFRINLRKSPASDLTSQVLFFERREGGNQVTSIPISNDGAFSSDQPESYRAFFISEQLDLLV